MRVTRWLVVLAAPAFLSCTDEGVDAEFTLEPGAVEVALEFAPGMAGGGPRTAYSKTDRVELRFDDATSTREQQVTSFTPRDTATHIPVYVRLRRPREELSLELELRLGGDAVFRGTSPVVVRAGRTTPATVVLEPVVWAVAGPDDLPVLTAYGDTMRLSGALRFVTGDTINPAGATWASLDPGVATISGTGTLVARSDGSARLVARFESFADTVRAEVFAEVANIAVQPANQSIPIGQTRQYSAIPMDRRGNPIPGRPVVWSTSDPSVLTIDAGGVARAVGVGAAKVIATIGAADGEAVASSEAGAPLTENLTVTLGNSPITATFAAGVYPNGGNTDTWFEWAPISTQAQAALTLKRNIGSGLLRVPVNTTVQGLLPATSYEVRIVAANSRGMHQSETVFFTTGIAPPSVTTLPASGPVPPFVTANGTANANGSPGEVWFEWAADSTMKADTTAHQSLSGSSSIAIWASVPSGPVGSTWYYRIVARNAAGTSYGKFLSWTVLSPPPPPPPPPGPIATTLAATIVGDATATLAGTADPRGVAAEAWFEYGTDPALSVFASSPAQAVGAGTTAVPFSATVGGLQFRLNKYYYRAVVRTANGTARGAIVPIN